MKNLLRILLVCAFVSSCVKQEVTKYVEVPKEKTEPEKGRLQGTINGGGGKGVLCTKGDKKWVEVLDLYEAKVLYDLEPVEVSESEEDNLRMLSELIAEHYWNPDTIPLEESKKLMVEQFRGIRDKVKFLKNGQKLHKIDDSFEMIQDKDCEVVQVAAYLDESVLVVDSEYWKLMKPLDQMGLLLHEIIYLMARQEGAVNSIQTRKFVGHLLSKKGLQSKAEDVPLDDHVTCSIDNEKQAVGYFYAYPHPESKAMNITFNFLQGYSSLFKLYAEDLHTSFDEFFSLESGRWFQADIQVDTYPIPKKRLELSTEDSKIFARFFDIESSEYSERFDVDCSRDEEFEEVLSE